MPPNPIDEAANANQRPVLRSARSSERTVASGWAARPGIHRQSAASVTTPSTPTTTKATRQPTACPMMVDSGTPTTFAIVSPAIIVATARPRRDGPTTAVPITAPTPKKAPCGSPATNRAAISQPTVGANAESTLPTVNATINEMRSTRRSTRAAAPVSSGAPMTTPSA